MTEKKTKILKFLLIPLICIFVCCFLYVIFDYLSNGIFLDWLDKNFTYERSYINSQGETVFLEKINWSAVKSYLLYFSMLFTSAVSIIIVFAIKYSNHKNTLKNSHNMSQYIDRYILNNEPLPVEIPQEYAEVFAKISEAKLKIQQNEKQLLHESERKNDLITYLAHDLKTPLTSVIGYFSLLNDEKELSQAQRQRYISIALGKAERLEELINELFEVTRFNITEIELQTENINLSKMLLQLTYEFNPLLRDKGLRFKHDIEENVHLIFDVDKLERIIDNLIRNAVNYSYSNSEIGITLKQNNSHVIMYFENKGKTIPKEKLSRIFEQFYRIDSSRNSATGGSGLGLAIAKQLVEAGGGKIAAQSSDETVKFTVTIPKSQKNI